MNIYSYQDRVSDPCAYGGTGIFLLVRRFYDGKS